MNETRFLPTQSCLQTHAKWRLPNPTIALFRILLQLPLSDINFSFFHTAYSKVMGNDYYIGSKSLLLKINYLETVLERQLIQLDCIMEKEATEVTKRNLN